MREANTRKAKAILGKYLPEESIDYVASLLLQYKVRFRVVKPRSSKLGDFRHGGKLLSPEITVNGDLNPYSFLITTLHEFAHLVTHLETPLAAAHGEEWKSNYRKLLLPMIEKNFLPKEIQHALVNSLVKVKASSCRDKDLYRALIAYDKHDCDTLLLEQLPKNANFTLNGRQFEKGTKRRTKFLCIEDQSKRLYLVDGLAKVQHIS